MKSIFKTKLTENQIEAKIQELQEKEANLKTVQKVVKNEVAEALATGAETAAIKKQLLSISADLEMIPASIEILEQELQAVQTENEVKKVQAFLSKVQKKKAEVNALAEKLVKLFEEAAAINTKIIHETNAVNNEATRLGVMDSSRLRTAFYPAAVIGGALNKFSVFGDVENAVRAKGSEIIERVDADISLVENYSEIYIKNRTEDLE